MKDTPQIEILTIENNIKATKLFLYRNLFRKYSVSFVIQKCMNWTLTFDGPKTKYAFLLQAC